MVIRREIQIKKNWKCENIKIIKCRNVRKLEYDSQLFQNVRISKYWILNSIPCQFDARRVQ